ncbi:hypothetical protein H5410_061570 [Solanum commersonii]|uniref:Uncharacterized protein n=1 Tax=Solanum commersonii TaxID=4109 RepID=A0A9J5W986_SOLCO|nr:hypothetical protein H5410_061570 [Solanum commersonii]
MANPHQDSYHLSHPTIATGLCPIVMAGDGNAGTIHILPSEDNEHFDHLNSVGPLVPSAHSQGGCGSCNEGTGEPCLVADSKANSTPRNHRRIYNSALANRDERSLPELKKRERGHFPSGSVQTLQGSARSILGGEREGISEGTTITINHDEDHNLEC